MSRYAFVAAMLSAAITLPATAQDFDPTFKTGEKIKLRAWGVPGGFGVSPSDYAKRQIMTAFREKYPTIDPIRTEGLQLPGLSTMDVVPMMQIAGGIPNHVPYVNFRQSQTYISKKLLYPLDQYIEDLAGVTIKDSSLLSDDEYLAELKKGPGWPAIDLRAPRQCWEVMRRDCPYGGDCPYQRQWAQTINPKHEHVWAYPVGPLVIGVQYLKSLFAEYEDQGIEQRAPENWEEMLRWAQILNDPTKNQVGLNITLQRPGWHFLSFLYSAGGRVVVQNENGDWYCVMDSDEAVEAAWFFTRLRHEEYVRNGQTIHGVLGAGDQQHGEQTLYAMQFNYLDARMMTQASNFNVGFGPVPKGPTGKRGSEFNSMMCGIFSGLADQPRMREAAWNYVLFYDGDEARRISTEVMIESGLGRFVRPQVLRYLNTNGRYDPIVAQIPAELEVTYRVVYESGIPEPYGQNCQYVYEFMMKPLGAVWQSDAVTDAVNEYARATNDADRAAVKRVAKQEIKRILVESVEQINQKMLDILPPAEQRKRSMVSWAVIFVVIAVFLVVLRQVFKAFRPPEAEGKAGLQLPKYWPAYLLMAPGVLSIAVWMYWPLVKGTIISFQDYSVLGDSEFIGARNFAEVLWDPEFWHSLWVSLKYALLFMVFGFCSPIALALLLQEVPRGKVFYRTLYYMPAVLSGLVVIFLWKAFYGADGLINAIINGVIKPINAIFGTSLQESSQNWLMHEPTVLFWALLPTIWAGMGPGCLIYLAAFKTVPDEMYEAADIDGAGIAQKVFHIAVPSIKALILINFIGAMIGAIRGAGGFMLAMTGGGPFGQYGGATEVIGLKLWLTTFGYLKFGTAAAMAWVVGAMLIGFTVMQLKRLSRMEFRAAATEEAR